MKDKKFKLSKEEIKKLIPEYGYCFATDRITVDGEKIKYMYQEEADKEGDSGWRFFAGDETQEYADDPDNNAMYDVNTIANYDPTIVPFLDAEPPADFEWNEEKNTFVEIEK
jgi:hypothetical protein